MKKKVILPANWEIVEGSLRRIMWFPYKDPDTGKTCFGKLKNPLIEILIKNDFGVILAIRKSQNKSFTIKWPPVRDMLKLEDDRIDRKHPQKGAVEIFESEQIFQEKLTAMGISAGMVEDICDDLESVGKRVIEEDEDE